MVEFPTVAYENVDSIISIFCCFSGEGRFIFVVLYMGRFISIGRIGLVGLSFFWEFGKDCINWNFYLFLSIFISHKFFYRGELEEKQTKTTTIV